MNLNNFQLKDINLKNILINIDDEIEVNKSEEGTIENLDRPIAIIGMHGQVGSTNNLDEFWDEISNGNELYSELSKGRQEDVNKYLKNKGSNIKPKYLYGTLLSDISGFDYKFFSLSKREATYLDPNQRLFLETTYNALEDAGYCQKDIRGSNTGVFVGFSSDFGDSYRRIIHDIDEEIPELAIASNINSMIASRISYFLNLKGPAMLYDTACSSALVAIYNACKSILKGECNMAIAGSVKCNIIPMMYDSGVNAGVRVVEDTHSKDNHTRTFDNRATGTMASEGTIAFILKDYDEAIKDKDNIRAVIVGGGINQDGASNGITSPNQKAQRELILKSLSSSKIKPEKITFIEAHGTATKLGDPIEVSAIKDAFSYETKKKQFCSIGTVKSNIGHMDHCSGAAGLAKVILALEHKFIPPTLNFSVPNSNINFIDSPVYVNENGSKIDDDKKDIYGLINSFGLSGTNCNLIVKNHEIDINYENNVDQVFILPISAKSEKSLFLLCERYYYYLRKTEVSLRDMVFTATKGRDHFDYRIAIKFSNREELIFALANILNKGLKSESKNYGYGVINKVIGKNDNEIINSYINGFTELLFKMVNNIQGRKISIPTYIFDNERCWVESNTDKNYNNYIIGKLINGNYINTYDKDIVINNYCSSNYWELNEHKLGEMRIFPGTAFIEMAVEIIKTVYNRANKIILRNIIFKEPFFAYENENKELQIIIERNNNDYLFKYISKDKDNNWIENAELTYFSHDAIEKPNKLFINDIKEKLSEKTEIKSKENEEYTIKVSDRWTESFREGVTNKDKSEFLLEFSILDKYKAEVDSYYMHPALLDIGVNAVTSLINEGKTFLPFSYEEFICYQPLISEFYVHLKKIHGEEGDKLYSFNIVICDPLGNVIAEIKNYNVKSLEDDNVNISYFKDYGYKTVYKPLLLEETLKIKDDTVILVGNGGDSLKQLKKNFTKKGLTVNEINLLKDDINDKLREYLIHPINYLIFNWENTSLFNECEIENNDFSLVHKSIVNFIKTILILKIKVLNKFIILTENAKKVLLDDNIVNPIQNGIIGLFDVISREHENLNIQVIDFEKELDFNLLLKAINSKYHNKVISFRDNKAYLEELEKYKFENSNTLIKALNVAIISGGTGALGEELAKYLAKNGTKNIILLGSNPNRKIKDKWEKIKEKANLEIINLNIRNYLEVKETINTIRNKYGEINGVFHLAGKPGDGYLFNKSVEEYMEVFDVKAIGALNLHFSTLKDKLDYFVMYSSIASIDILPGQSDYTAANMVLDSLSQYRKEQGLNSISIQWPAWNEIGMAYEMDAINDNEIFCSLKTKEAMELLNVVLGSSKEMPSVIMPGRKNLRIAKNTDDKEIKVILSGISKKDDIIENIGQIWGKTLELENIDINDEFSDLGGNSLLSSIMLKEYNNIYPDLIEIADLFTYTTIKKQAEFLNSKLGISEKEISNEVDEKQDEFSKLLDLIEAGEVSVEDSMKYL